MPKKSKKFIDKKNAVTFHLVHRSQKDPLIADENASQRVLLPANDNNVDKKKRIEEQHKYGIYFDDDYNYLQHLRDTSQKMEWERVERIQAATANNHEPKIKLPSSVFASEVEEDVGLLNKAAPRSGLQLDLDPDIVAAMDDDFDFDDPENQLEDNFIELANVEGSEDEYETDTENFDGDVTDTDEERDEVTSLKGSQLSFNEEETKSRFTNYSMSSSVIRRNEQLTLLDDRFEKMYATYDENEIGALDCDEIEGHVDETSNILLQYADEFEKSIKREQLDKEVIKEKIDMDSSSDNQEELEVMEVPEKEKWDCQSILSTYSNIYNRPKLITEPSKPRIKINMKTGMPVNILGSNKLTAKALAQLDEANNFLDKRGPKSIGGKSVISQLSTLSIRPKNESPEERRDRKRLLKEYRKERRLEKKANTEAFKEEAKRQVKITINRNNVQGNKIV